MLQDPPTVWERGCQQALLPTERLLHSLYNPIPTSRSPFFCGTVPCPRGGVAQKGQRMAPRALSAARSLRGTARKTHRLQLGGEHNGTATEKGKAPQHAASLVFLMAEDCGVCFRAFVPKEIKL